MPCVHACIFRISGVHWWVSFHLRTSQNYSARVSCPTLWAYGVSRYMLARMLCGCSLKIQTFLFVYYKYIIINCQKMIHVYYCIITDKTAMTTLNTATCSRLRFISIHCHHRNELLKSFLDVNLSYLLPPDVPTFACPFLYNAVRNMSLRSSNVNNN